MCFSQRRDSSNWAFVVVENGGTVFTVGTRRGLMHPRPGKEKQLLGVVYSLGCMLMWLNDPSCNDENKKSVKGTISPLFDSFVEECRTEDPCRRPYVSKLMHVRVLLGHDT